MITLCLLLAGKFLDKEGIEMAVQTGVTWKQEFPGKSNDGTERKQSMQKNSKGITD